MHRAIIPLLALILNSSLSLAGEIKWTATGTVDSVNGASFSGLASLSDSVEVEFTYNDAALREPITEFPGLVSHFEYREEVNIDFSVTIGKNVWSGSVDTGIAGGTRTIEVQDFEVGPESTDLFKLVVAGSDGASFSSFPGAPGGASNLLNVEFSDGSDTAEGPDYLGSSSLVCVAQGISRITAAKGLITDSVSGAISYAIDPASIKTEIVGIQEVAIKRITFENDELFLTWVSVPGKSYAIEYLDEFLCWKFLDGTFAEDPETTHSVFPSGAETPKTQLYRVVEEE